MSIISSDGSDDDEQVIATKLYLLYSSDCVDVFCGALTETRGCVLAGQNCCIGDSNGCSFLFVTECC